MSKAMLTRANLLRKAFNLIYKGGYQATSIDEIIAETAVTKGAFFYHFKNKEDMGLAIINEIMYPGLMPYMNQSLGRSGNIKENLYHMMEQLLLDSTFFDVDYGCPAVNLIEEMAPLNPLFKNALVHIIRQWHTAIVTAVIYAQQQGQLGVTQDADSLATYIIAGYTGIRNTGKVLGQASYLAYLAEYHKFLERLD